jgi:hypothetical protein
MNGMDRTWHAGLAFFVVFYATRVSAAELTWESPAECRQSSRTLEQVERLIGRGFSEVDTVDFAVTINRRSDGSWRLLLSSRRRNEQEQDRTRELVGSSCDEVTSAVAVAIAMAIEESEKAEEQVLKNSAGEDTTSTAQTPSTADKALVTTPKTSEPSRPSPWRFSIGLGVLLDKGALPKVAPGGRLEVSAGVGAFKVVGFGALFASQQTLVNDGERGGEFSFVMGGLLACGVYDTGRPRLLGCGGFEIGQISGEGVGMVRPRKRDTGWRALPLDVGIEWPLSKSVALGFRVGITVPLTRRNFVLDGVEPVYRPSAVTGRMLFSADFTL